MSKEEPSQSVSVSSGSIEPSSLSLPRHTISLPETNTSPKDIPNQLDQWSVDFNGDVKPALNMKLENVLTPGAKVWCVRFSPDGKYLAVGVHDGRTYIYDAKTGAKSLSVAFILVGPCQLTFVTVSSQITPIQASEAFRISVSPRMVTT